MTKDTLPLSEPVMGHHKQNLTEKAKQAAEVQPREKVRTKDAPVAASIRLSTSALVGYPDPDPWVFRAPGALPRSVKIYSHG